MMHGQKNIKLTEMYSYIILATFIVTKKYFSLSRGTTACSQGLQR